MFSLWSKRQADFLPHRGDRVVGLPTTNEGRKRPLTLYKRGKIYWAYVTIDGVRHCRTTGTGSRKLAESIARKFEEELLSRAAGLTELHPEMTFTELSADFFTNGDVKPHHKDRLKVTLPFWGPIQLRSITKSTVRAYRLERLKQKKLTDTTLSHDIAFVRHLLFWAMDEGYISFNPLSRLRLVRSRKRRRPILSWAESQLLRAHAAPHLQPIILMAEDTGQRRGELLQLCWEDIDLARGLLSVTHSKTVQGEQREIPLTDRLRCMLTLCQQPSGLVFTFKGQPIANIKTAWKAALRRSGIRPLRFHDLRHTFNTRLLELGVIADVRKALMGHSLGDDPHALYSHVELPTKRKAIEALNKWIWEQMESSRQGENKNGETTSNLSINTDGNSSRSSL